MAEVLMPPPTFKSPEDLLAAHDGAILVVKSNKVSIYPPPNISLEASKRFRNDVKALSKTSLEGRTIELIDTVNLAFESHFWDRAIEPKGVECFDWRKAVYKNYNSWIRSSSSLAEILKTIDIKELHPFGLPDGYNPDQLFYLFTVYKMCFMTHKPLIEVANDVRLELEEHPFFATFNGGWPARKALQGSHSQLQKAIAEWDDHALMMNGWFICVMYMQAIAAKLETNLRKVSEENNLLKEELCTCKSNNDKIYRRGQESQQIYITALRDECDTAYLIVKILVGVLLFYYFYWV